MNAVLHVLQVCALAALIGAGVALVIHLARAAAPGLAELLNRYGPMLVTLGLRLRDKLTGRRK